MVVAGVSSSGRGSRAAGNAGRFYCPPPIRRQQLLLRQQQQQQRHEQRHSPGEHNPRPPPPPPPAEAETALDPDVSSSKPSVSSSSSSPSSSSSSSSYSSSSPRSLLPAGNLERFLKSTTPIVPARYSSKVGDGWSGGDDESSTGPPPYFELGDLWESFSEWSAYGAGVPLVLNGSDAVVQYYVPFLSAIQLYADPRRLVGESRCSDEKGDINNYQDTSSESNVETNKESLKNTGQEGLSRDRSGARDQLDLPVFQYLEHDPPYARLPLADKISALASKFPGLRTYKSCDLLPSSWISVAWYPIYRIPTGSTLQDLDACFLTFHSLTTSSKEKSSRLYEVSDVFDIQKNNGVGEISLPTFGLALYKFKLSVWISNGLCEQQLSSSLMQAADNWLQLRHVDHPDYRFFLSHYSSSCK